MPFPRPSSPRTVWRDLRAFLGGQEQRHKAPLAALAIAMPVLIVLGFAHDAAAGLDQGRSVIYVQNWREDRSDAAIEADQKVDQAKRDAQQRARRDQYRRVADQLGIQY